MPPALCLLILCLCSTTPPTSGPTAGAATRPAGARYVVGQMDAAVLESSGLAASRRQAGIYWTHSDSGNRPELFAIDASGALLGKWPVATRNIDWEDLAADGRGTLYVADIGNNQRRRTEVLVHAVAEPAVPASGGAAGEPLEVSRTWTLRYPPSTAAFDAEALVVVGSRGFILPKLLGLGRVPVYAFDLDPERAVQTLERIGELPVRLPVTAADVSPDGRWLAVLTVAGPYLLEINGNLATAMQAQPRRVLFAHATMEACAFTKEGLLATTETRDVLLFRWGDFGLPQ